MPVMVFANQGNSTSGSENPSINVNIIPQDTGQAATVDQAVNGTPQDTGQSGISSQTSQDNTAQNVQGNTEQKSQEDVMNKFNSTINHDGSSMIEEMIARLIGTLAIATVFIVNKWMQFKSYGDLLFNGGKAPDGYMPIDAGMWYMMDTWYKYILVVIGPIILVSVIIMAIKFIIAGYNPKMREEAKEHFMRVFLAAVVTVFTPALIHVLFFVNNSLVKMLAEIVGASNLNVVDQKLNIANIIGDIRTGSAIADAFVLVLFAYIEVKLNLMFIIRTFTLIIFYIFTPIVSLMWTIDKNVNAMGIWLGEILSNVFMQFFYAFVFMVYISLVHTAGWGNWVQSIVWAMLLLPIGDVLRNSVQGYMTRLSGLNESAMANQALGFLGLAGLTSAASSMAAQFKPIATAAGADRALSQITSLGGSGTVKPAGSAVGESSGGLGAVMSASGNPEASMSASTGNPGTPMSTTGSSALGVSMSAAGGSISEAAGGSKATGIGSVDTNVRDGETVPVGTPTGGTVIGASERLANALNRGYKAGYYTERSIHGAGKLPAFIGSAVFGEKSTAVLNSASKIAGGAVRTAVGSIATIRETRRLAREENIGFMDALGKMTGTDNKWKAGFRAVSLNVSNAISGPNRVMQKLQSYGVNTSIDGIRYR